MAATQTWFCGKASLAMGMKNSGSATSRSDRVTENMFNCCTECSRVNFGDQSRISSCEELPQYINWRDFPAGHATRAIIVGTQPWVLGSHFFSFFFFPGPAFWMCNIVEPPRTKSYHEEEKIPDRLAPNSACGVREPTTPKEARYFVMADLILSDKNFLIRLD